MSASPAHFTCPVCGFAELTEPHVDPTGSPTYSICPCCGTHFGADDVEQTHAELRKALKKGGMLTRDARAKERKKYGMAGARKRFQFSKR